MQLVKRKIEWHHTRIEMVIANIEIDMGINIDGVLEVMGSIYMELHLGVWS